MRIVSKYFDAVNCVQDLFEKFHSFEFVSVQEFETFIKYNY